MSLIIFFGMALCIFIAGAVVIGVTFYHWYKQGKLNKKNKLVQENQV